MLAAYPEVLHFVQWLAPTWRKPQHVNFAQLICAFFQQGNLILSDLARAMPRATQKLHGRLKRIDRFLDNPRLDEPTLFLHWLKLTYHFDDGLPPAPDGRPIIPLLLDTVYFEPFALLVGTVPCGSRGLPVALTTYHRYQLQACFPAEDTWPSPLGLPPRPGRHQPHKPASSLVTPYLSQNQIEEHLIAYLFGLLSPALFGVLVADRGFARAALFLSLQAQQRAYVIRFDAQTYIRLPSPLAPDRPCQGLPKEVLGLQPGQRVWCPEAYYGKVDQVPIRLLAVWDEGQKEPWYLATSLDTPELSETLYRWRMRLECANRDEKTGVILRAGGDQHALTSLLHLHRLLLALCTAEWLCALTGLQAWHDLSAPPALTAPSPPPLPLPTSDERALPVPTPPSPLALPAPDEPALPASILPSPCPLPAAAAPTPVPSPTPQTTSPALPRPPSQASGSIPEWAIDLSALEAGPAMPPPVLPHRGPTPRVPAWMRCFTARGWLSYVRLGKEVICTVDFHYILQHMVRWLATYLWGKTPLWRPYQIRYRLRRWWFDSS